MLHGLASRLAATADWRRPRNPSRRHPELVGDGPGDGVAKGLIVGSGPGEADGSITTTPLGLGSSGICFLAKTSAFCSSKGVGKTGAAWQLWCAWVQS
jgi:hypothetical protein